MVVGGMPTQEGGNRLLICRRKEVWPVRVKSITNFSSVLSNPSAVSNGARRIQWAGQAQETRSLATTKGEGRTSYSKEPKQLYRKGKGFLRTWETGGESCRRACLETGPQLVDRNSYPTDRGGGLKQGQVVTQLTTSTVRAGSAAPMQPVGEEKDRGGL